MRTESCFKPYKLPQPGPADLGPHEIEPLQVLEPGQGRHAFVVNLGLAQIEFFQQREVFQVGKMGRSPMVFP